MKNYEIKADGATDVQVFRNKSDPKKRIEVINLFGFSIFTASLSDSQYEELITAKPNQRFSLSEYDDSDVFEMSDSKSNDINISNDFINDIEKKHILSLLENIDVDEDIEDLMVSLGYIYEGSECFMISPFEINPTQS